MAENGIHEVFDPEDGGTAIIRNTSNSLPVNTAERPRRLESLSSTAVATSNLAPHVCLYD
jgi:hypothetical protein